MDLTILKRQLLMSTVFEEMEIRKGMAYYFKLRDNYVKVYFDKDLHLFILSFKSFISVPPDFVTFSNIGGIEFIQIVEKTIDNFDISFD